MKLKHLIVPAMAAAALVGCSPTPGTAVIVDGKTYSRHDVRKAAESCITILGLERDAITETGAAQNIALNGLIGEIEDAYGEISPKQLQAMSSQLEGGPAALKDKDCAPVLLGSLKVNLVRQSGASAVLAQAVTKTDVVLNPMYGELTPNAEAIFQSSSLSRRVSR